MAGKQSQDDPIAPNMFGLETHVAVRRAAAVQRLASMSVHSSLLSRPVDEEFVTFCRNFAHNMWDTASCSKLDKKVTLSLWLAIQSFFLRKVCAIAEQGAWARALRNSSRWNLSKGQDLNDDQYGISN